MFKQTQSQRFIYKLHSKILAKYKWNLTLPLSEAMKHKTDIIALASSQCLRFIDEINGVDTEEEAQKIKREIKDLKKDPIVNKKKISHLYYKLYEIRFQPDYMCLIIDRNSDYNRALKGFTINGIKYRRFQGTPGGIKNSTIIFVNEEIYPQLKEKQDCGRDKTKKMVAAKLEAYQALMCSGSIPLSMPHGIIVVPDCITHFKEDVIFVDDAEDGDPTVELQKNSEFELIDSDGYGFMLPSISKRWNDELGGEPDKTISAVNTRGLPWTKGMLFTFDFIDFAEKIAENYMVQDVWGDWRDVRDAEVILTEGMLKLWDSYNSYEDYMANVEKYGYKFAVSKVAPYELENERRTNYQFLQTYELDDEDLHKLIDPTINEINDVIGMDYRKSILFLKGKDINPKSFLYDDNMPFVKALMIEPELINDKYVRDQIYRLIENRMKRAKIGVIDVSGNFAIIGGDPYSLAQHMFGLPVTGLLKKGECYHKHWIDKNKNEIVCFRAPMTSHNNIRKMHVAYNEEINYWYRYIETCMLLNSWDSTCEALNGADKDGDLFFTTDNDVLLRNTHILPTIRCVQRRAEKKIVEESDIVASNKASFGDAIGSTTNIITSQICLQSNFPKDSAEYKELEKRIICGQLYQQNAIDKAKGIVAKPMPRRWKDSHYCESDLDKKIVANKKPYFFIYNYDYLFREYNSYLKTNNKTCRQNFRMDFEKLKLKEDKTEKEELYISWFYKNSPVDYSPCVINRMCWIMEKEFDKIRKEKTSFDYNILKSDGCYSYDDDDIPKIIIKIRTLFKEFQIMYKNAVSSKSDVDSHAMSEHFKMEFYKICPDEKLLLDTLIDICYSEKNHNLSRRLLWTVCGDLIIQNLLHKRDYKISVPIKSKNGDFIYCGDRYYMITFDVRELGDC